MNDNRTVALNDITVYSATFGAIGPNPPYTARQDLNNDGRITLVDISNFSAYFGKSCAP